VHYTDNPASIPRGVKATTTEGAPISEISGARRPALKAPPAPAPGQRPPPASEHADDDDEPTPSIVLGPLPTSLKPGDREILEGAVEAARASPRLARAGGLRRSLAVDLIERADDPRLVGVPEWSGGFAVSARQVYLLSPYLGAVGGGRPRAWNEMTLHEVAHAQQQQWTGNAPVPRWFREGYAQYVSGEQPRASASDVAWWATRHGGAAPLLNTWNSVGKGPVTVGHASRADHALFAYGVSLEGVLLLVDLGGDGALRALLEAMHRGASFEAALEATLGVDERELERRFLERVRPAYGQRAE